MNHAFKSLAVGCIANSVAKTAVCPMDQVKTYMQASDDDLSVKEVVHKIYVDHGLSGFWRGNSAALARSVPFAGIKFAIRESITNATLGDQIPTPPQSILIGATSGSLAAAITYPLDSIRTKMVVHSDNPEYSSLCSAFKTAIKEEGVSSLYHGVSTTIMGAALTEGTNYLFYNSSKKLIERKIDRKVTKNESVGLGIVSGIASQTFTYPIDTVRKKLQSDKSKTIKEVVCELAAKGPSAFYPGLTMNTAKVLPASSITLYVREGLMNL